MNSWIRTRNSWIWISTRIFEFQLVTRNSWLVFYHITVDVNDVVLVFLLLVCFTPFSIASTLDFEQVNVSWVVSVILFIFHIFLVKAFQKSWKSVLFHYVLYFILGRTFLPSTVKNIIEKTFWHYPMPYCFHENTFCWISQEIKIVAQWNLDNY